MLIVVANIDSSQRTLSMRFINLDQLKLRCLAIVMLWFVPLSPVYAQRTLAITGATLETASEKGTLKNATLLIKDGKIEAIGTDVKIPVSAQVVNATGKTITPGFVDPYYVVTIGRESQSSETRTVVFGGRVFTIGGGAPSIATTFAKIADGLDVSKVNWQPACRSGITTFHVVAAGYAQSLIAKRVLDSDIGADVEVQDPLGKVIVSVSNETKSLDILRSNLKPAETRGGSRSSSSGGSSFGSRGGSPGARPGDGPSPTTTGNATPSPTPSSNSTASTAALWSDICDGKTPMFVNVNNASAILHVIAIFAEYPKAKVVLIASGPNVFNTLESLDGKRTTVILPPTIDLKPNSAIRLNVPKMLTDKDVPFVFSLSLGQSDFQTHQPTPLFGPAMLVRAGLDRQAALHALTIGPAKLLGIEKEVGSLEVGKQADLVVFDGDPFSVTAGIEQVYISGALINE